MNIVHRCSDREPKVRGPRPAQHDTPYNLSPREIEVLRSLATGRGNKGMALDLGLSPHTIADHMKVIYRKLEVSSQVQAVLKAERAGLLEGVGV